MQELRNTIGRLSFIAAEFNQTQLLIASVAYPILFGNLSHIAVESNKNTVICLRSSRYNRISRSTIYGLF